MRKYLFAAGSVALAAGLQAPVAAAVVDFEATPLGAVAEGTNIGGIVFTSQVGSGLAIVNALETNNTNGLAAFNDFNGNFIKGAIAGGASFISLDFGNDQVFGGNPVQNAVLRAFMGATLVGTTTLAVNFDDLMNQTISFTGAFDNFTFSYEDASGNPATLIEAIDNINYRPGNAVPEPATWGMMLLGFGLAGTAMRRRTKVSVSFA